MNNLGNKAIMAKNIQYYLDQNKKDRADLCNDLGFKYTTVSNWLQGVKYPRIDKIELMARYFGVTKADLVEEHTPSASAKDFAQEDKDLVYAYHKAPDHIQQSVDAVLGPYKPISTETKVKQLAELLSTIGIACTYTDENSEGDKGDFVFMYMKSYERDGKMIDVETPLSHIDPLNSTYEELLPAIRAKGTLRKELLSKYKKERFDIEMALINEKPYISNSTLVNVGKSVVEKRQERNRKDNTVKYVAIADEIEYEAVK